MSLPNSTPQYNPSNENQTRQEIDRELSKRVRKGDTVYFNRNECVISSPDGSRWAVKVADDGTLSTEARS